MTRAGATGVPAPLRTMALALVLLAALAACSTNDDGDGPSPGPSPGPQPGRPVLYTAIGASDAVGVGSSAPCVPFSQCPDGRGYVPIIARELAREGATVTLNNLGVPGAVLSPGIQAIGNQYGRGIPANFLQQQLPFVRDATVVTVFAGGNDANAIATAVDRGAGGNDPNGYIDAQVRTFASDYAALVRGIRERAPAARVVVLNLPNFAGLPFTAGFTAAQRRYIQRISVGFSREGANALAGLGIPVVDLLCDGRSYQPGNYSADGFHPSDAGYAFMAAEALRAINGVASAPQGDCGRMRMD
jgi:lysophospholipase L1-like esterase